VEEQVKALGAESAKAANVAIAKYLGYAHANLEAVGLLKKSADSIFSGGDLEDLITEINESMRHLREEARSALDRAKIADPLARIVLPTKREGTPSDPEPDPDF
jgi:uncharacterized protein YabN with tetrapyrrole methylase and pyrophosphatase domain